MNCIEARRKVTPFVEKKLTDKETEQFLKHIEHCSDCMDELDIYYTAYKAIGALDSNNHKTNDFRKMMEDEIHATKRNIRVRKSMHVMRSVLLVLTELLLLLCLYSGYQIRRGEGHLIINPVSMIQNLTGIRVRPEDPIPETPEEEGE